VTVARLVIALLCLLLLSCSSGPRLAPLAPEATVLAFGDSLTFGTGAGPGESYPAVLETLISRRVVNAGIPGEESGGGRERLAGVLEEQKPALMILCLGGNDFLRGKDEATVAANLRAMVQTARERGVAVVLIAVPRLGFGLEVPKLYAELAAGSGLPLEGKALKRILGTRRLKSDPLHPNAAGYRILAEAVAKLLTKSGAI